MAPPTTIHHHPKFRRFPSPCFLMNIDAKSCMETNTPSMVQGTSTRYHHWEDIRVPWYVLRETVVRRSTHSHPRTSLRFVFPSPRSLFVRRADHKHLCPSCIITRITCINIPFPFFWFHECLPVNCLSCRCRCRCCFDSKRSSPW